MIGIKDRELVFPGRLLGDGIRGGANSLREGNKIFSSVQGMARVKGSSVDVIPSKGGYLPKQLDVIIGIISKVLRNRWLVDINSTCLATMRSEEATRDALNSDLSKYFRVGDLISAKISRVDEVNSSQLIRPWKLEAGLIIEVNPKRIPRVVGKKRSMLTMIKEKTGCKIVVGQNGRIWLKGNNLNIAIKAIRKIEREAQTQGLTDRIERFLSNDLLSDGDKNEEGRKD